ncbi:MAG: hypothetical protein ACLQAT_24600 [Candidatus Binataceae bacterium]
MSGSRAQGVWSCLALAILVVGAFAASATPVCSAPKYTVLGVGYSPAHMPFPSESDVEEFFNQAAQIGSGVTLICDWRAMPPPARIRRIRDLARSHRLKFHLYLDPIALEGGRNTPAVPKSLGQGSLRDPAVRRAYEAQVMELAALQPDYLGLATEVNLFAQNSVEYAALLDLVRETYLGVKKVYPSLPVTVSFQWDVMSKAQNYESLYQYAGIIDVYSFTSYPDEFGDPNPSVADDYFLLIRKVLPDARIGISELGWSSAPPGSQQRQLSFFGEYQPSRRDFAPST